jgi:hypothetical protein
MKCRVWYVLFGLLILCGARSAHAECPSGPNYLNPATNQPTTLSGLGVTSCYYIAANGLDTNSGITEATPWAHAPGMATCTNRCAAVTPGPGTGFIFRGGDTWGSVNYFKITNGGVSGAPVYYGVDQTWYSGSAWNRPGFNIAGNLPHVNAYNESLIFDFEAGWVTVDWFEITGGTCSASPVSQNYFWNGSTYDGINVTNGYFHAFQPPSAGCGPAKVGDGNNPGVWIYTQIASNSSNCHGYFAHNVVDGTDGSGAKGYLTIVADPAPCATFAYNVVHDICSGFGGSFRLAHDNVIGNFGGQVGRYECAGPTTIHNHAIRTNVDATIYDNEVYEAEGEVISVNPQSEGPGSYIYNNVLWANNASSIDILDQGSATSGSVYIFNNNIDAQTGGGFVYGNCINVENSIGTLSIHNEFHLLPSGSTVGCVMAANPPFNSSGRGTAATLSYNPADDVNITVVQANADGRSASSHFAYVPTTSTDPAIGIGITGINAGEANDTTYACSQTTLNGVVQVFCPERTPVTRALNATCSAGVAGCADAGAYQYQVQLQPAPPQNLTGTPVPQ